MRAEAASPDVALGHLVRRARRARSSSSTASSRRSGSACGRSPGWRSSARRRRRPDRFRARMANRYVYDFDEPTTGGRELLGGKGIGLAEMTLMGVPGPGRVHDHDRRLPRVHGGGATCPTGSPRGRRARAPARGAHRQAVRLRRRPAARLRPLGCRRLDARDDGHDPQPRAERRGGRGPRGAHRQPALRVRLVPPPDPDVRRGGGGDRRAPVRDGARGRSSSARRRSRTPTSAPTTCASSSRRTRGSTARRRARDFPTDAREQLLRAVRAVFASWDNPRAQVYRRAHEIADDLGTAVNVVQMVFGNKGDRSGTGVAFTRDPSTGEAGLYGEFLANAQGEDVVAGIRTPQPIEAMRSVAAEGVRAAARDDAPARGALPRHAGHRVHRRGRAALPPADALGEADRRGGAEGGGDDGRRGADLARGRGRADRSRRSSTSCCTR